MKKTFILLTLLCLLCFLGGIAFAQKTDETAIKAVIEKETVSWMAADAEGWANCWKISPYTRVFVSETNGKTHVVTPDMMTNNKQYMGGGGKSDNSNYNIVITNTTAWATYDQVKTGDKGDKSYSHEVRMLEKIAGSWKIVAECVFHYDPDRKD